MRIISFALGNIWRWTKSQNRNDLIEYIKKLPVNGVEITFSSKEELYKFELSKSNTQWLKNLKYVSIHAPFHLVSKAGSEGEIIKQLEFIARLYTKINAQNVIIHPQELPSPNILNKFNFDVSTENLPPKRKITIAKLKNIFKNYPKIGFCLDVSHAYHWSEYETSKLIKAFGEKITQIHFSGTYRQRSHQSLRIVSKDFTSSIKPIFQVNAPIVIEEDVEVKSNKFLHEEINFIKNMLEN